ncbi:hypothetical protein [Zwartia sp.]|uniref:hypothetical protein n=1 Tax=Zwartia sp. TaxID=2978004 RepID=UPI0027190297|nr:hypothetical protein [Zwartia sp.]MDO9024497.1 hypothetical protein [Zwartia sp.]
MQSDPKHTHTHTHGHAHDHHHAHEHSHAHPPLHTLPALQKVVGNSHDLKSPVLMSVWQRLLFSAMLLAVLWLAVIWALRTNG